VSSTGKKYHPGRRLSPMPEGRSGEPANPPVVGEHQQGKIVSRADGVRRVQSQFTQVEADWWAEVDDRWAAFPPDSVEPDLLSLGRDFRHHRHLRTDCHGSHGHRNAAILIRHEVQGQLARWRSSGGADNRPAISSRRSRSSLTAQWSDLSRRRGKTLMVGSADGDPTVDDRVVGVSPKDIPRTGITPHGTVCNGRRPGVSGDTPKPRVGPCKVGHYGCPLPIGAVRLRFLPRSLRVPLSFRRLPGGGRASSGIRRPTPRGTSEGHRGRAVVQRGIPDHAGIRRIEDV
jgi:hypothetical protein